MARLVRPSVRNRLLRALSDEDFALLLSPLNPVILSRKDVLIAPGEIIEHVYFVEEGIVSLLVVGPSGQQVEVGVVGWDGMVGVQIPLGTDRTPHQALVQVEGRALRMPSRGFRRLVEQSPSLQTVLLLYVQAFLVQAGQTALASASFKMDQRLARWLLMCHDRIDGDEIVTTHAILARMLGVNRPGVTDAIRGLEDKGLVRAQWSSITIINRPGLEVIAGDAYGIAEAEYHRLFGPQGMAS